jgi:hypothetical protein
MSSEDSRIEIFVSQYAAKLDSEIRFCGDPEPDSPGMRRPRREEPTLALRQAVLEWLFDSPSERNRRSARASNVLLRDLFVAVWEYGVANEARVHEPLAREVLNRDLYEVVALAYRLPLGMDQGLPLHGELLRRSRRLGKSIAPDLARALDAVRSTEPRDHVRVRLSRWRQWALYEAGLDGFPVSQSPAATGPAEAFFARSHRLEAGLRKAFAKEEARSGTPSSLEGWPVKVALDLYETDAEFRSDWDFVKGDPPHWLDDAALSWIRKGRPVQRLGQPAPKQ